MTKVIEFFVSWFVCGGFTSGISHAVEHWPEMQSSRDLTNDEFTFLVVIACFWPIALLAMICYASFKLAILLAHNFKPIFERIEIMWQQNFYNQSHP